MTDYDYKVIPAPRRAKRIKGIRATEELFAHTLTDAINEVARQGWEFLRAEHLPAEAPRGWFRPAIAAEQTVLVFRRPREALGPRLAAVPAAEPELAEPLPPKAAPVPPEQTVLDRMQSRFPRREPSLRWEPPAGEPGGPAPRPLRPAPRLGPAEKS